ncbi:MAG: hypothetical protein LBH89_02965 [Lactococcus lactis]|jgi:hypothetical protein|nr:hypothetical protein [Lactococcus lactis]
MMNSESMVTVRELRKITVDALIEKDNEFEKLLEKLSKKAKLAVAKGWDSITFRMIDNYVGGDYGFEDHEKIIRAFEIAGFKVEYDTCSVKVSW